jgi:hypothetical protein
MERRPFGSLDAEEVRGLILALETEAIRFTDDLVPPTSGLSGSGFSLYGAIQRAVRREWRKAQGGPFGPRPDLP